MSPAPPAIIVSVPARTIGDAAREVVNAGEAGADLAELRIDRLAEGELSQLGQLFPSPLPLLATLRSRAEGGEGPDAPNERAQVFRSIARHPFRWIDVELARDQVVMSELLAQGTARLIVSSHSTTAVSAAVWGHLLRAAIPNGAVRKVVVSAPIGQLLKDLIPDLPPPGEVPLVALTTGASGPLLRLGARRFGFPFVFAAMPSTTRPSDVVEPSQIPIDRLGPFLRSNGSPPLFGVAGRRIGYSVSPELHSRWMAERGKVGLYVPFDFENEREFVDAIPTLVEGGLRGLNVTQPFKRVAAEIATEARPGARTCGVANTLSFHDDAVVAENTDLVAILRRFDELRGKGRWSGGSIGIVGGGGAARATLAAARALGVPAVIWTRREPEAEALAEEFGARAVTDPTGESPALVVHATPVGRQPADAAPRPLIAWSRPGVHVVDWVYAPSNAVIGRTATSAGASYEDGMRLLCYQAAASFGIWWGEEPDVGPVAELPEVGS